MITTKIRSENGLHARPASEVVNACSQFNSEIFLQFGDHKANARSIMNLLALNIQFGDDVVVIAEGIDAEIAEETISKIIGGQHA